MESGIHYEPISNGKRKGQGNVKNGNPYLGWAYMEAAQFALRYNPSAQQFYQRKLAKSNNNTILALRPWPTNSHGRAIPSCGTSCPLMPGKRLAEVCFAVELRLEAAGKVGEHPPDLISPGLNP